MRIGYPYRVIAAIPFAFTEQVCKEIVGRLLGPTDPWHQPHSIHLSELSNEQLDLVRNGYGGTD